MALSNGTHKQTGNPTEILRNPANNTQQKVPAKVEQIQGHGRDPSRSNDNIRTAALMTAAATATAQSSGTPQEQQEAARLALLSMLGRKGPPATATATAAAASPAATAFHAAAAAAVPVSMPTVSQESGLEKGQTKVPHPQSKGALDGNKLMTLLSKPVAQPTVSTVSSAGSEGKRHDTGDLSALLKGQLNISGNNTVNTTPIIAPTPTSVPLYAPVPLASTSQGLPTILSDSVLNPVYFPIISPLSPIMMNPATAMRTRREAVAKAQLEEMERKENASKETAPEV